MNPKERADLADPEKIFERRWAMTVLETALARLRQEMEPTARASLSSNSSHR